MDTLQIMEVLASGLAIALVIYWYLGEKKKESKAKIITPEVKSSTIQTVAVVEEKSAALNQEVVPQTTTSTPVESHSKTEVLETSKLEPLPQKEPEPLQAPEITQEIAKVPEIKEESSPTEIKVTSTRKRRAGGTRRRKTKEQESETPQQ